MRLRGLCIRSRAAGVGFLPRNPGPSPGIQMGFQAHLWLLVIVPVAPIDLFCIWPLVGGDVLQRTSLFLKREALDFGRV